DLGKIPNSAHAVIALPYNANPQTIRHILSAHECTTVVLCPPLIGFRDEGFFDLAINALRKQNGSAWQELKDHPNFEAITMSDLCGFLISVFWNKDLYQKTLICPHYTVDAGKVLQSFETELDFSPTVLEKIFSKTREL